MSDLARMFAGVGPEDDAAYDPPAGYIAELERSLHSRSQTLRRRPPASPIQVRSDADVTAVQRGSMCWPDGGEWLVRDDY